MKNISQRRDSGSGSDGGGDGGGSMPLHVLLTSTSEDDGRVLRELLESAGYKVTVEHSIEAALTLWFSAVDEVG
eukprot:SAG11_NODE_1379_length_5083_cov_3.259831_1_plen_74_part_00